MPCLLCHPFKVNRAIFPAWHPKIAVVFGVFAALARWGVKTGAGVMERVPIIPLGEGWNPE